MIAEFAVFISMAAVCFSGILFSLWVLGMPNLEQARVEFEYLTLCPATSQPEPKWKAKSIAWLMTQVWFGNS
jgi:hypothetical protein